MEKMNLSPYKMSKEVKGRRKSMDPVSEFIRFENLPNPNGKFELQNLIGIGTSAKVYVAYDKLEDRRVAVKIISNIAENILEIESEFRTYSLIGGQCFFPKFYGAYLKETENSEQELWFVMEICDGISISCLLEKFRKAGKCLNEKEIAVLMKSFLIAIHHLHENNIIHRDIRASNFILTVDGDIKLIDYGSCAFVKDTDGLAHSSIGSPYWMAPEVITCEQKLFYSKYCDIWSLGITGIELAETKPPLSDIHQIRAMFQIARYPPPTFRKVTEWSDLFKDFINECLVRIADHRPCTTELMFHPFIVEADDKQKQLTIEEYLNKQVKFYLGDTAKNVLHELAQTMNQFDISDTVVAPSYFTVKNWYLKKNPDTPFEKILPDDIACMEYLEEENIIDLLGQRLFRNDTFTFVGDILVSVKPKLFSSNAYNEEMQNLYCEKARSNNPPHIFAVADRAYQQMIHHKKSQLIILQGISGTGKSFLTKQIIKQLSFLGKSSRIYLATKMRHICFLLDSFGSAWTVSNTNGSLFLKSISVSFTQSGKLTGGVITSTLLDLERVSSTPEDENNFNVFYYIYEGLKAENKLDQYGLSGISSFTYLPNKDKVKEKESIEHYSQLITAFKSLLFSEEEIFEIIKMISTILLLGNIDSNVQQNDKETISQKIFCVLAKYNHQIKREEVFSIFNKAHNVEEIMLRKDVLAQFLYINLFNWIVQMMNRQLSFSKLVLGDKNSVCVVDFPGFQDSQNKRTNQLFHLYVNIVNDLIYSNNRQLMFYKELKEYKDEDVDIPFHCEDIILKNQNISDPDFSYFELLKVIQDLRKKKQDFTEKVTKLKNTVQNQRIAIEGNSLLISHNFGKVYYDLTKILHLDNIHILASDFHTLFKASSDRAKNIIFHEQVNDDLISRIENIQNFFSNVVDMCAEDFPHVVICIKTSDNVQKKDFFVDEKVVEQMQIFKFQETAILRQNGYARRLNFREFLNRYKFLAFDFNEEVEFTKENCQLLLIRLKMTGWKIGRSKVFLKYYAEEYLTRQYERNVKNIIKVQAMARRYIVKMKAIRKA